MKLTHLKIIASGSTIEVSNYQDRPIAYDFKIPKQFTKRKRIFVIDEETRLRKLASRESSMKRAGSNLRRLINCNAYRWIKPDKPKPYLPTFITFTFKEEVKDFKIANPIFTAFIRRLNYELTGSEKSFLRYVAVPEFQDKNRGGVIHYHVVFFNLKHIWKDKLKEIWGQGIIDITKIKHVTNVGAYISKYMSKDFDDTRLDGHKRYFPSRGLKRPIIIKRELLASHILKLLPKDRIVNYKKYTSKKKGDIVNQQYLLKKKESIFDIVPNLNELL
ncbi:MAG: hypothetical protein NT068_01390 [Candidatus Nomurabacteria bacterium]|nr:hypothetical protein [Candidatus Nomurabacteria bacterium]